MNRLFVIGHTFIAIVVIFALFLVLMPTFALAAPLVQTGPPAPTSVPVTAEWLAAVLSVAVSLAFAYIPGLKTAYGNLASEWKAAVMGIALVVVAGAAFGVGCAGLFPELAVSCDRAGAVGVVSALIAALVANQATYQLAVKPFQNSGSGDSASAVASAIAIGDAVHYVSNGGDRTAIVTHVWGSIGMVNLYVPPDGPGYDALTPTSVLYNKSGKPGTWHFPSEDVRTL